MRKFLPILVVLVLSLTGMTQAVRAADPVASKASQSVTHHTALIGGRQISYTAAAGTMILKNAKSEPAASMFYVAYTEDGLTDLSRRPVTFFYNGGPGSGTIWLHMGSFGPKRVFTTDASATPPAPYRLVDNEYSLLDKTDLVFIDAVGTGFSRIIGKGTPKEFYGVDPDARAFEQFIQHYVTTNNRWNSPKFLFAESYGTTRSAVLVNDLQSDGMDFNGVVLLSSYLNPGLDSEDGDGNDFDYIFLLPTEAAVAWYHNKLPHKPADLAAFVDSVRQFAVGDYATALLQGWSLSASRRNAVAHQLHEITGMPESYIRDADLRIDPGQFSKLLLHSEYRVVGGYDARFVGIDTNPGNSASGSYDPSYSGIAGAFNGVFNSYVRNDLKFTTDLNYIDLGDVGEWDEKHNGRQYDLDVLPDLRDAMTENPHLRVFSANGYFDMVTPFFQTQFHLSHMGLDRSLQNHITFGFYQSGHMAYLHVAALQKMKVDLARFYDSASNAQ